MFRNQLTLRSFWILCLLIVISVPDTDCVQAQQMTQAELSELARRSGLSEEELMRRYRESRGTGGQAGTDTTTFLEPGRSTIEGIDDTGGANQVVPDEDLSRFDSQFLQSQVVLPFGKDPFAWSVADSDSVVLEMAAAEDTIPFFGTNFFKLDPGVFNPPSFGPVPADYLIGVGDQIVVDLWGEVEFRIHRIVERDGTIILPKGGKIVCQNRTLEQVNRIVRERLARSYSGLKGPEDEVTTYVDVTLGALRSIRVFVVGDAAQPGSYELSSVSTIFTALYSAGGPSEDGSLRDIRLVRDGDAISHLDVYEYLLEGKRVGDELLREGDTVLIPPRGPSVLLEGEVRRPIYFEMKAREGIGDLIRFAGGFTAQAASEVIHVKRTLPFGERLPEQPDQVYLDIKFDGVTGMPINSELALLYDGDKVMVDRIESRLQNWVKISGNIKRPGQYQYKSGMSVSDLIEMAGGIWPDTLTERAIVDRTTLELEDLTFNFPLGDVLTGVAEPVLLQAMDEVQIFSRWDIEEKYSVHITGQVQEPKRAAFRKGMTLRDLVMKAGGLKQSADKLRAEISRVRRSAVESRDLQTQPSETVDAIVVELGDDFLTRPDSMELQAHDRVAIRKLPWWELQRTVNLIGEVYFPGQYSLERPDETLSELIIRAGGLKPNAYWLGARVMRDKENVGNIAIELEKAIAEPKSQWDIIMQSGDTLYIPERMYTVKVLGEVGFPTSLVHEEGRDLNYYVDRAGGYRETADKHKTRVVYPNGLSLPNKGGPRVVAGSTIVVPMRKEGEWERRLESMKEISAIFASLATVWLVIDKATSN